MRVSRENVRKWKKKEKSVFPPPHLFQIKIVGASRVSSECKKIRRAKVLQSLVRDNNLACGFEFPCMRVSQGNNFLSNLICLCFD